VYYGFPMPLSERKGPPIRMINIGFIMSNGFDKIVNFSIIDNTKTPKINPDFEPLKVIDFSLEQFKRIRIYYSPGSTSNTSSELNKTIKEARKTNKDAISEIEKIILLFNKATINRVDTTYDITRYNGNPETISLHLFPNEELMIMPDKINKPFVMITIILTEQDEIEELETDWIIIRHFKKLNSSYLYFLSKDNNKELYNMLKELKGET